jgi:hypothetical protein
VDNLAAINSASASDSDGNVAPHSRPTAAAVEDTLDKPFKKVRFSTIVEVAYGHDQDKLRADMTKMHLLIMSARNFDDCGKSHLFEGFVECVHRSNCWPRVKGQISCWLNTEPSWTVTLCSATLVEHCLST